MANTLLPENKSSTLDIACLLDMPDCDMAPIIPELLTWLQDANWPVYPQVLEVLRRRAGLLIPHVAKVLTGNDYIWTMWLLQDLIPFFPEENMRQLIPHIIQLTELNGDEDALICKELALKLMREYTHLKEENTMSMCKERAWKLLSDIGFVRVAGTDEELKAANIIKEHCEQAGVPAVIEDFEIDVATIKTATLEVLEPEYHAYPVIGIGKTKSTPADGIVGGFKYIEDATDANITDVEGKIVLMQGRGKPDLYETLAKKGALGYISIGGNIYEDESIKNELRPTNAFGKDNPLPGLRIHISEAEKLVLSKPTKVKIVLDAEQTKGTSHNVVATIEGTDLKDEVIAFSAHYDSVPYSKGIWDNGTGSVTISELMHYFKEKGTRRTLKFVWCGAEEIGLVGSREYCKAHEEDMKNYIFNINFDMTGVTIGYEHCCCSTSEDTMHAIEYLAKINNYPLKTELGTYSSDSTSFASAGVPAVTFARLNATGGATIHNHNDTFDRLDPDSFMITLNFVAPFAEQIANAPVNPIPRKLADKVNEKIEEGKKRRAAMEKKDEEKKEEEKKPEEKR